MTLYKISNWNTVYESHETRKLEVLRYVYLPNKHDGLGFRRIAAQKNACELFAAWILLVEIASKGKRGNRGVLAREGMPLDADECALMTGFPSESFKRAFNFFSSPVIGWLEASDVEVSGEMLPGLRGEIPSSPANPPLSPADLPLSPDNLPFAPADLPQTSPGIEGIERKKGEKEEAASPMPLPFSSDAFKTAWHLFEKHRSEIRKPLKPTSAAMSLKQLAAMGEQRAIRCIEHTITKGWQGLREPDATSPAIGQQRPSAPAYTEPFGWKSYLNNTYPSSVYSANGSSEAHEWAQLPRDVQGKIAAEMAKERRSS